MINQIQQLNSVQITALHGDMDNLPCQQASLELAFANMSLQWSRDLQRGIRQIHSALIPGGTFALTLPGPKTLFELKHSWQQLDAQSHVNHFLTQAELATYLQLAGFKIETMAIKTYQLNFPSLPDILKHLKSCGAQYVWQRQLNGLIGKNTLLKLSQNYNQFCDSQGQLPCTYEIIFAIAHKE
jgi:malonyl-CoA O-methyltransferase